MGDKLHSHKKSLSQNLNCNQLLSNLIPKDNITPILRHNAAININQHGLFGIKKNSNNILIESRNSQPNIDNPLKLNGLHTNADYQPLNPNYFKIKQCKLEQINEKSSNEGPREKRKLKFSITKTKKSSNYSLGKIYALTQNQTIKDKEMTTTLSRDKINLKGKSSYTIQDYSQSFHSNILQHEYSRYDNKLVDCADCDELKQEVKELRLENKQLHRQFIEITNNYSEAIKELNNTRRKYDSKIESLKSCLTFVTSKFKASLIRLSNDIQQFKSEKNSLASRIYLLF